MPSQPLWPCLTRPMFPPVPVAFRSAWRGWAERKAIRRCLSACDQIVTVCDARCGTGTRFSLWRRKGWSILGIDVSSSALELARAELERIGASRDGRIVEGTPRSVLPTLEQPIDLIVCCAEDTSLRLDQRIALWSLAAFTSRRYVLVSYEWDTAAERGTPSDCGCSWLQVRDELRMSGIRVRRIETVALSNRVIVLGERIHPPDAEPPPTDRANSVGTSLAKAVGVRRLARPD